MSLKSIISCAALLLLSAAAFGQADRRDVRAGNRKFRKGDYKAAEIDYRKAVVKDSTSMAGSYNLSNDLYRQEGFEDAGKAMEAAARGADLLVTGELTHVMYHCALESGVAVLALGHYASEISGPRAVMREIGRRFGIATGFAELPTGL